MEKQEEKGNAVCQEGMDALKDEGQRPPFPIVGIGASAGGLEALESFFDHVPSDCPITFVVIQHLSPTHKSIMRSLLSKHTEMDILDMEDDPKKRIEIFHMKEFASFQDEGK